MSEPSIEQIAEAGDEQALAHLERLSEAAVGLIEPLLSAGEPKAIAAGLADAVERCAETARGLGLHSLGYLAAIIVPSLRRLPQGLDDNGLERGEQWSGELIALCGGQLEPSQVDTLVEQLKDWPHLGPVNPALEHLVIERLRDDAATIRRWSGVGERQLMESVAASDRLNSFEVSQWFGPGSGEVAHDELAMLAEAADAIGDEAASALLSLPLPVADAPLAGPALESTIAAWREMFDGYGAGFTHLSNAITYLQVDVLARLVEMVMTRLQPWIDHPERIDEAARSLLLRLPDTLSRYLRSPGTEQVAEMIDLLREPGWPIDLPATQADALARGLRELKTVASRQVSPVAEELGPRDMSLAIPPEADQSVVDSLLAELPVLTAQFADSIQSLAAGSVEEIEGARRAAHTLKGSANTVGIRGMAHLTHRIEDVLHLLTQVGRPPSVEETVLLVDASDLLAEMSDAVLLQSDLDDERIAWTLYQRVMQAVQRLHAEYEGLGVAVPFVDTPSPLPDMSESMLRALEQEFEPADSATPQELATGAAPAVGGSAPAADSANSADSAHSPHSTDGGEALLRVPDPLIGRLLDQSSEAMMALAGIQERLARLEEMRRSLRDRREAFQDLALELSRLVDLRGVAVSGRREVGFDALELDEFNDLHMVSRRIAEASADHRLVDQQFNDELSALRELAAQLERIQGDLRESAMRTRMLPVATLAGRFKRIVRQAARMSGKRAELEIRGDDTAIDAQLLQQLIDPLSHLLRNAVDHGLEETAARVQRGKPEIGRIELAFEREGVDLRVICRDDGAGMDLAAIRARATERGLIAPDAPMDDAAIRRLVLAPGFSTRRTATQLSGRGVGLDVVQQRLRELRGRLAIDSMAGQGTTFTLTMPVRMAAVPAMIVHAPHHVLALSVRDFEEIRALPSPEIAEGAPSRIVIDGEAVALRTLESLLALPPRALADDTGDEIAEPVLLMLRAGSGQRLAVLSPPVSQTRNLILRPLHPVVPAIAGLAGVAVLGDGSVAPLFDLSELAQGQARASYADRMEIEAISAPSCLVIDDSVSVRRSMELFLRDLGLLVDSAGDGLEGLERVAQRIPDLVIVDLEMPRMNGVEFTRTLRADPVTATTPIIMITSRTSERHERIALDAGVTEFLVKPYTEDDLASRIQRLLAG